MNEQEIAIYHSEGIIDDTGYAIKFEKRIPPRTSGTLCMYFWIPKELKMGKGKVAGQVAHASARLARMMNDFDWIEYQQYEVKIVYKVANISDLFELKRQLLKEEPVILHTMVYDNSSDRHTVFGILTRKNLKNSKWKLL